MDNIRKEMEVSILSTNKYLKDKVSSMSYVELLANIHPVYRSEYASKLLILKLITKDEAKLYTKVIGINS